MACGRAGPAAVLPHRQSVSGWAASRHRHRRARRHAGSGPRLRDGLVRRHAAGLRSDPDDPDSGRALRHPRPPRLDGGRKGRRDRRGRCRRDRRTVRRARGGRAARLSRDPADCRPARLPRPTRVPPLAGRPARTPARAAARAARRGGASPAVRCAGGAAGGAGRSPGSAGFRSARGRRGTVDGDDHAVRGPRFEGAGERARRDDPSPADDPAPCDPGGRARRRAAGRALRSRTLHGSVANCARVAHCDPRRSRCRPTRRAAAFAGPRGAAVAGRVGRPRVHAGGGAFDRRARPARPRPGNGPRAARTSAGGAARACPRPPRT